MTDKEFVARLKRIATEYKTEYVLGCFGAPLTSSSIGRYLSAYSYNKSREPLLRSRLNKGYFGFDCVCLIKAVLWGWNGDSSKSYGGAVYSSNGVGDISERQMRDKCNELSYDISTAAPGELLWMEGHVGVYIGNGLAVECTPAFKGGVQITCCQRDVPGYSKRIWTCHGKLPWISYSKEESSLASHLLNGSNCHRAAETLIRYTGSGKTATNKWGTEIRVDKNGFVLTDPIYGACKLEIPREGCVLSGHGESGRWILENIRIGSRLIFKEGRVYVIPCGDGYVSGENVHRGADQLVIYRGCGSTGTNQWGKEMLCSADSKVIEIRPWGVGNAPIPKGGFVLSGHGKSADWLHCNVSLGDRITVRDHRLKVT